MGRVVFALLGLRIPVGSASVGKVLGAELYGIQATACEALLRGGRSRRRDYLMNPKGSPRIAMGRPSLTRPTHGKLGGKCYREAVGQ